ncbi:DUF4387 domain-containing protein [Streptomyces sp. NPDC001255]|uniref:DUF4387 domain-containing protein n=1 Tax=Streptomyces sp. NPDC001255 TaxID=3364550 RepID=UPI0036C645CE
MATLLDLCSLVRSKNAGPFTLTFDFMCHDEAAYAALTASGFLTKDLFSRLYGADPAHILLVHHPRALAVKVSLPRPEIQGSLRDADCYAGQQYAPLMDLAFGAAPTTTPATSRPIATDSAS